MSVAARHWADWNEVTFVAGIRFLFAVYRRIGRWPFRLCLWPVIVVYWALHPGARRASRDYLRRWNVMFGPRRLSSLGHFLAFGEALLDKLRAASGDVAGDILQAHGIEAVQARIAQGRGGLMVTAHVGCLELCQAAAEHVPGLRLNVLVHTRHAERFNAMLRRLGHPEQLRLLQVTEIDPAVAADLAARVERGEYVAIVGDRVPVGGGRVAKAQFLGAEAAFPVGPWVLASLLRCPVYLLCCRRAHDHSGYRLDVNEFAEQLVLPRATRLAQLDLHVQRYADWLQAQLADAPYQWFNFFDFWSQRGNDER